MRKTNPHARRAMVRRIQRKSTTCLWMAFKLWSKLLPPLPLLITITSIAITKVFNCAHSTIHHRGTKSSRWWRRFRLWLIAIPVQSSRAPKKQTKSTERRLKRNKLKAPKGVEEQDPWALKDHQDLGERWVDEIFLVSTKYSLGRLKNSPNVSTEQERTTSLLLYLTQNRQDRNIFR